jgi:hypothetical protein
MSIGHQAGTVPSGTESLQREKGDLGLEIACFE